MIYLKIILFFVTICVSFNFIVLDSVRAQIFPEAEKSVSGRLAIIGNSINGDQILLTIDKSANVTLHSHDKELLSNLVFGQLNQAAA